jgi:hypothetical protein
MKEIPAAAGQGSPTGSAIILQKLCNSVRVTMHALGARPKYLYTDVFMAKK